MTKNLKTRIYTSIILFSLLLIGCKSLKNTENKPDFKKISTKSLLSQVINKKPEFDFIQIRSQATILNNNSKNQFNFLPNPFEFLCKSIKLLAQYTGNQFKPLPNPEKFN